MPLRRALGLAALALAGPVAAQPGPWALTNVRIQTVTRGVIDKGTVVIRNGLIEAVGPAVPVPAEARVLDLPGWTVSPGITDLASAIAPAPAPAAGGGGPGGQTAAAPGPPGARPQVFDASRSVAGDLRPSAADLKAARDAGITAVLLGIPRGGIRGQPALVPTRDSLERGDVIRAPVAVQFGFQGAQGAYPATLLGVIAYQRQMLYDAQRYGLLADRYRADPRGLERPVYDPALEALVPVVRGALPAFFEAGSEPEIRRAVRIAEEFKLKLTVIGATEGWRARDALRGRSAVVSVNFPRPAESSGWAFRLARRDGPDSTRADSAARVAIERNPALLHQAGIAMALGTGGVRPADFLGNVRRAVKAGLPAQAALEAITIRPAELVGLGPALGSVEPGKIANLVVTENGDLLGDSARVRLVFVDGVRYEAPPPAPPARAGAGGGAGAQVGGTWAMNLTSPQGPMEITLTFTQSGAELAGSMTSILGTTPIEDGRITGRTATWSATVQLGAQSITITYTGEVDGTRMTGTANLGTFGTAPFTAEKKP